MKNTAAIALLVARAAAQDRADMAQDRNKKDNSQRFQSATQEDRCKDAGVDTADGELTAAVTNVGKEEAKVVLTGKDIIAKLADQSLKTIALAKADLDNKVKVDNDIKLDKLELAARRAWDVKVAAEVAAQVLDDAQAKRVTDTTDAETLAKVIFDGATKAKADAATHKTEEEGLRDTARTALNSAMNTWNGKSFGFTGNATVDAGRKGTAAANDAFVAGTKAQLLLAAKTALNTAVGKCTPGAVGGVTGTAWTQAACVTAGSTSGASSASTLVKYALRKQLGTTNLATSIAARETYLDAYCMAAQQLGATDADIKAGKAYWSKANPGVRLDFKFSAVPSNLTNDTTYLTTWTFETLGAPIAAVDINNSAAHGASLAKMTAGVVNDPLWLEMKCWHTNVGTSPNWTTTGNAGRIYGVTSGKATTWNTDAGSAVGGLAAKVLAAKTMKDNTASGKLEAVFILWKAAAKLAMVAYDTMISTDKGTTIGAAAPYTAVGSFKCTPATSVVTTLTLATEAVVNVVENTNGTSKAKRPSNLIAAVDDAGTSNATALIAEAKLECEKLPSMGLYVVSEVSAYKPLLFKEVCQGIQYQTAVSDSGTRGTFITRLAFVSKAAYDSTGTNYITIAASAASAADGPIPGVSTAANLFTCIKRKNTKGVIWRGTTAKNASNFPFDNAAIAAESPAITGGVYLPTNYPALSAGTYATFKTQMALWVTSRVDVHTKYSDYLVLKEVVTNTGNKFRAEKVAVSRNEARLTGTGTNTNGNLTAMYETKWREVYGAVQSEIPAIVAEMSVGWNANATADMSYKNTLPKAPTISGTGKYALWVAAAKAEADADKAYKAQKVIYDTAVQAVADQVEVLAKATAELTAITLVHGPTSSANAATGTRQKKIDAVAEKVKTKKAVDDAKLLVASTKKTFDEAVIASNAAEIDALTTAAYTAIKTARDKANTAVAATKKALADDVLARAELKKMLDIKVGKDVKVAAALTTCKNTKYDAYKATLSTAMADRVKNLATIKTLLEKKDKAAFAAGATGARCNKGLSQGNGKARAAKPCTAETDCCGAAKGPVLAATAAGYWKDAPVMTIETCQPKANKTYKYAPPRAPMALTDPADAANAATQQDWPFVCIGGASKLAAAASALATAAYMMA